MARVWFIGAGPGAPDLLTVRGARLIGEADVVIWARSLVNEMVMEHASPDAEILESTTIPLEGVRELYERAVVQDLRVARVHSGDPSIYGAVSGRTWEQDGFTPHWRGIHDEDGRLTVAINFNMDLGDAWEHADVPEYALQYTTRAYKYAINYVLYAMTH